MLRLHSSLRFPSQFEHVHVVPLVSQAMEILVRIPKPNQGDYLLSSTDGRAPLVQSKKPDHQHTMQAADLMNRKADGLRGYRTPTRITAEGRT